MSINPQSPVRRQFLAGIFFLASIAAFASTAAAETPQISIQPGSVEERLHASSGRETDLEIARSRPTSRELAARARDERSAWSYEQCDAYGRRMRGK